MCISTDPSSPIPPARMCEGFPLPHAFHLLCVTVSVLLEAASSTSTSGTQSPWTMGDREKRVPEHFLRQCNSPRHIRNLRFVLAPIFPNLFLCSYRGHRTRSPCPCCPSGIAISL
ncbi:hypothetical protein FA15DRAFT_672940 [Coprinopsis marcescibilis]|uniref:Uncharacterized protein n=1 Tax=Coprinopsis marcescibilis TaxID=230819 RepID=A0A5C3KLC6_COPMA|nr:hypothetical protein FA15DRAFT_672940 [Coprinopsis marcescibilis]